MRGPVRVVHDLISGIDAADALEAKHRGDALVWLETTDDVFRRVKPDTPDQHLVSYVVLVDPEDSSTLLVAHRNAGLWLPAGGHVEPAEHPADAAEREAREELGIESVFMDSARRPFFITVTRTVGHDRGHTDVSLWFLLAGRRGMKLTHDQREFTETRWWSKDQMQADAVAGFDPHYLRFMAKLIGAGPHRLPR